MARYAAVIMDHEHEPTPGPAVWIGAGVLAAIGGGALLWVSLTAGNDDVLTLIGSILVTAGVVSAVAGIWRALRRR
ncbi:MULTISPECIES: hypothetical protein [unclassified Microbacterium]|uniref:hypothetical protein n=1 Tax=unclassified Microbacterium TaxID=2609290 RepID=UPI00301B117D